jgi:hypothetical protein
MVLFYILYLFPQVHNIHVDKYIFSENVKPENTLYLLLKGNSQAVHNALKSPLTSHNPRECPFKKNIYIPILYLVIRF